MVDVNTSRKCEWYCKSGFHRGSGLDVNKCLVGVFSPYSCNGLIDGNALLYFGDDVGLTVFDLNTNVLVDVNTSRKCEWYCKSGFHRGSGLDVNKCISQIDDPFIGLDNEIIQFYSNDNNNNLFYVKCKRSITDANVLVKIIKGVEQERIVSGLICSSSKNEIYLGELDYVPQKVYAFTLVIPQPCIICSKEIYVAIKDDVKESSIPDANIFSVIILLISLFFVLKIKQKK